MSTIQNLFQQAQLAEAAYADFTNNLNDPAGALTNPTRVRRTKCTATISVAHYAE